MPNFCQLIIVSIYKVSKFPLTVMISIPKSHFSADCRRFFSNFVIFDQTLTIAQNIVLITANKVLILLIISKERGRFQVPSLRGTATGFEEAFPYFGLSLRS